MCGAAGGCTGGPASLTALRNLGVPGPGTHTVSVRVRDAAGNWSGWSDAAMLRYDPTKPPEAEPPYDNGWINGRDAQA